MTLLSSPFTFLVQRQFWVQLTSSLLFLTDVLQVFLDTSYRFLSGQFLLQLFFFYFLYLYLLGLLLDSLLTVILTLLSMTQLPEGTLFFISTFSGFLVTQKSTFLFFLDSVSLAKFFLQHQGSQFLVISEEFTLEFLSEFSDSLFGLTIDIQLGLTLTLVPILLLQPELLRFRQESKSLAEEQQDGEGLGI